MDGAFVVSEETEELAAAARRAGADLVGAEPDQIVFGANSTSLLLHLSRSFARTIGPGDTVVVTRLDHDANVRPWVLAARDAGATVRWVDLRPRGRHPRSGFVRRRARRPARAGGVHARVQRRGHRDPGRRSGGACEVRRRPRRGRRRPLRAAPFDRLPRPGRRHGDRLAVQGVRTAPGHGGGEARDPRRVGRLPRPARRALPLPRTLGDRHPEPRGVRRVHRGRRLPRRARPRHGRRRPRPRAPTRSPRRSTRSASTNGCWPPGSSRAWRRSRRRGCTASPDRPAGRADLHVRGTAGRPASARTRRRRSRSAGSSPGTGTTTRWSCSSGWTSWRRAAPSGSASATTTRSDEVDRVLEALADLA